MTKSRRDFLKTVGKGVGITAATALISHDLVAELIATGPTGVVLESKFKGMADIALKEAKTAGCSYADVRFTLTASPPGAMMRRSSVSPSLYVAAAIARAAQDPPA